MTWRCEKQRQRFNQCKGKAQTQTIGKTQMVRTCRGEHNHLPDHIETEI